VQSNQLWVLGHLITPVQTVGDYGLLAATSQPKVPGPPPHYHEDTTELFYVIEGVLDVMCNGNWQKLGAGHSFTVPRGAVHTFINNSDMDCKWITAFSPRGFEKFFTDFGIPDDQEDAFALSVSEERIQKAIAHCADYGMIIKA